MRVLFLEIENILSIQKANVSFDDNGLVLVEGWNYDTGRANGAGKTAVFNCLAFGLYDKLPRKITASEILRRGSKSGYVKCGVLCGEDTWVVQRNRPKGVEFFKNGERQEITQQEFESFIRLSYEQFLLTIYTPQANSRESKRFLASADADKKDFLLQLLNLNQFSSLKRDVEEIIKQKQASIDVETTKLQSNRAKISAYEESLVDVDFLNKTISELVDAKSKAEKEIAELSSVVKPDLSKYQKIEDDIKLKMSEIIQARTKKTMLHDKYRELNKAVADYDPNIACGECGSSLDTADARKAHAEHQSKILLKIKEIKSEIDDLDAICSKESSINDLSSKVKDKKFKESEDYLAAKSRTKELEAFVTFKNQQILNAKSKLEANDQIQAKIDNINESCSASIKTIDSVKKDLELYKTLSAIYSPTGAQAYVLDSIVDSFNEIIQKYIDIMSPNMTYTLNSFKENSKGDIVAKFSEILTKNGQIVSVGSLSGGEEKGLSLCVDFALMEVLETQFGMSLNPIILDEPFDGLDTAGREIVIDLLNSLSKNRQIFVIDHASEAKALFSKCIKIELRNEISTISSIT
jgi:DNA repair exonuclease SbcCD ATPase subunit